MGRKTRDLRLEKTFRRFVCTILSLTLSLSLCFAMLYHTRDIINHINISCFIAGGFIKCSQQETKRRLTSNESLTQESMECVEI